MGFLQDILGNLNCRFCVTISLAVVGCRFCTGKPVLASETRVYMAVISYAFVWNSVSGKISFHGSYDYVRLGELYVSSVTFQVARMWVR